MDLARRAGFEHQPDAGARAFADEVVMQAGDGEQRRDRSPFLVHAAVREHDHVDPVVDGLADLGTKVIHRLLQAGSAIAGREQDRAGNGLEPWQVNVLELGKLLVGEDGRLKLNEPGVLGRGLKQIALGANGRFGRGNNLLADTVNRRVGDLGKELLEVARERLRLVRQDGQGRVGAH